MGRTKNRKKRRLGAINKQMLHKDPWGRRYYHEDWVETRFRMWCGDLKFWFAVEAIADKVLAEFYNTVTDEHYSPDKETWTRYYERVAEVGKTLSDTDIKGKRFNSKRITYYRNRFRQRVANGKYLLYNDRTMWCDNKQTLEDYARWNSNK